jgi:hypothetical protein
MHAKFVVLEIQGRITPHVTAEKFCKCSLLKDTMLLSVGQHEVIGKEDPKHKQLVLLKTSCDAAATSFRLQGSISKRYKFETRPNVKM